MLLEGLNKLVGDPPPIYRQKLLEDQARPNRCTLCWALHFMLTCARY